MYDFKTTVLSSITLRKAMYTCTSLSVGSFFQRIIDQFSSLNIDLCHEIMTHVIKNYQPFKRYFSQVQTCSLSSILVLNVISKVSNMC